MKHGKGGYLLLGSKDDKYATWCPDEEYHLSGVVEAVNACINLFELIIHHPQ